MTDDEDEEAEEKADDSKPKHKVTKVRSAFFRKSPGDKMTDRQFRKIFKLLTNAYEKYAAEDGWADVSAAGNFFKRQDPGFDTLDYGFRKLSDIILYLKEAGAPHFGQNEKLSSNSAEHLVQVISFLLYTISQNTL